MADRNTNKLIMIASSTGGPKALHTLIPMLDKNLDAPVVIVQHMPQGFTASLASRLNECSEITVTEAKHGEYLQNGHVYLAKGGKHLEVRQNDRGLLYLQENEDEPINGLRPCADITLQSLKQIKIDSILCVVLTGMGADGYLGIKELKKIHNVFAIAQTKESCVVYGMPKAIVEHGLADKVLPLERISNEINKIAGVQ